MGLEAANPLPATDPADSLVWPIDNISFLSEVTLVFVISLCQLLTQSALGMSIAPLHIIGRHFGIDHDPGLMSWSPAAYSLTVGTFILVAGRIGDIYGHRKAVLGGWLWFSICGLLAGLSVYIQHYGHIYFDFMRALQGIGPAFLLPNGVALLGRIYPPGRGKDVAFSIFGLAAPLGFVLGATFSSLIGQRSWWPWIYWVHSIVCLISGGLSWFVIPPTVDEDNPLRYQKGCLDVQGCLTGVTGLVLINFAWNQGAVVGWNTFYVYLTFLLGVMSMGLFFWIEKKVLHPLVPLSDLSPQIVLILAAVGVGWSSFGIWIYYLWQSWAVLRGDTPLQATAQMSPIVVSGTAAALLAGYLMSRTRPGYILLGSMIAFCLSNVIACVTPPDLTYWAASFIGVLIAPFGMDCSFPAANLAASDFMPRDKQGLGASLVNTMINYSISIGLGMGSLAESLIRRNGSIREGYRGAHYVGIGLASLGVLLSLLLLRISDRA